MTQGRSGKTVHKSRAHNSKHHKKGSKRNQMVLLRWIGVVVALVIVVWIGTRCAGGGNKAAKAAVTVDETVSRVAFGKKGTLTVTSVETFDKDYYDQTELQEAVDSAVASYKDSHKGGVSAGDLTVENGVATLVMKYDSAQDYESFNNQEMFWGTLQEAEDAGYDLSGLSGTVNAQDAQETFGEGTALQLAGNPVIVITEQMDVITATNILYASSNLTIADDQYATVNGEISGSSPAILILQ